MPRPGLPHRLLVPILTVAAVLAALAAAGPARATKPMPGLDASWSLDAPARPRAERVATLRIVLHAPVRGLTVQMPGPEADPRVLRAFPPYDGRPEPGVPLVLTARVRIPSGPGRLEAVIRAQTDAGPLTVHAQLDLTPPGFGPAAVPFRRGQDRSGTPLRVYPGVRAAGVSTQTAPPQAAAGVLSGTFLYRDRLFDPQGFVNATAGDDPLRPVRFAALDLLENGVPVASGVTDTAGAYAFDLTPAPGAAYRVQVTSRTGTWAGPDLRVTISGSDPTLYAALTAPVSDPAGNVDLGATVIEPGAGGEAFNILDAAVNGARFVQSLSGAFPVAALRLAWHSGASWTTGFVRSGVVIYLDGDEGYDDCVILHEFGHYAMWLYSTDQSPGGIHYVNVAGQDPRLSWSEGFASFFQSAARAWLGDPYPGWYVDTYGTAGRGQLFFSFEAEGPSFHLSGIGSEVVVDGLLWDIVDGPGTPGDDTPGTDDDGLQLSPALVWDTVAGPVRLADTVTLEDFWDGWFDPSVNGGHRPEMESAFSALGVEYFPDAFENDAAGVPLVPDGHSQHHTFYPAGDLEPFTMALRAGDPVTVETLNLLNYGDTYLEVLDSRGAPVGSSDDRAPGDASSLVSFTAPADDTYLVHVTRAFAGVYSRYTLYGSYDIRAVPGIPGPAPLVELPSTNGTADRQAGAGVAFADYDGDHRPDLYLVNNTVVGSATAKDVLFRNDGNRTFTPVTAAAGLGDPEGGIAVAWGDYDNDGDPDLFVSDHGLYRNLGDGRFRDATATSGVVDIGREFDAAWVDADTDGLLDLFVVRRDGPSALWHNRGNGTFVDVAPQAGFDFAPEPGDDAYSCAWADADGDGLPDLFMTFASGATGQALFRNLGGNRFADVTAPAGLLDPDPATGGVWGDVNNDGAPDLFVASSGRNRLYLNRGNGVFDDRSTDYGVDDPGSAQGAGFADFDLDGDLDLYVVNLDTPSLLYENLGGTMLHVPGADDAGLGFGCAWGDIDGDGDPDLYVARGCGPVCQANRLYENHAGDGAVPWLKVRPWGNVSNRDGLGARIRVSAGAFVQVRERGTGAGWGGKSLLPETFGWPGAPGVDSVEVFWPSGIRDVVHNPGSNRLLVVGEGEGEIELPAPVRGVLSLDPPYPNPSTGGAVLSFTLTEAAPVRVEILDVAGRRVRVLLDRDLPAGTYDAGWDGRDAQGRSAAAGIYFYRVRAGAVRAARKLVRLAG